MSERRNANERNEAGQARHADHEDHGGSAQDGSGYSPFGRGVTRPHTPTMEEKKCERLENRPKAAA